MIIVIDPPKRLANLDKHGMDQADLTVEFFEAAMIMPAKQGRWMAIGKLSGRTIAVVFTTLGTEAVSIISMRPASKTERTLI